MGPSEQPDVLRPHHDRLLPEAAFETAPVVAPPALVERLHHDFDHDDVVPGDLVPVLPGPFGRSAGEGGEAAEALGQLAPDGRETGRGLRPAVVVDEKKIVARRAALELMPNSVVNLGIGMPDAVGLVANEERVHDLITLTVDPGVIGGVPLGGLDFGAALNFSAMIDHPNQFDFIDGSGLDMACLGFAECDGVGNINASRFAKRVPGCGGFINISQNSKKVVFVGTFTSGGLEIRIEGGRLVIVQEGRFPKFVETVAQVTYSGRVGVERDQDVLYVTERCVFRLAPEGLQLCEIAPGVDVERDILARLPFTPAIGRLQAMDAAIFRPEPMGLRARMLDIHIEDRLTYDPDTNTVFMNYAGMRVRTQEDLDRIRDAVDGLLGPLGRRVYSIVNYDRFEADTEVMDAYLDLIRYVEERYYLKVSRYTNSGFMRLKLGKELEKRKVSSHVYETRREAAENLTSTPGSM